LIHKRFSGFTSQEEHLQRKEKIEILINKNYLVTGLPLPGKNGSCMIEHDYT